MERPLAGHVSSSSVDQWPHHRRLARVRACDPRHGQPAGKESRALRSAMLRRKDRGGSSSSSTKHHAEDHAGHGAGAVNVVTGGGQDVTVSQFLAQLDEAARKRLDGMNQRLRMLEQQMETLEAEVGRASSSDY